MKAFKSTKRIQKSTEDKVLSFINDNYNQDSYCNYYLEPIQLVLNKNTLKDGILIKTEGNNLKLTLSFIVDFTIVKSEVTQVKITVRAYDFINNYSFIANEIVINKK